MNTMNTVSIARWIRGWSTVLKTATRVIPICPMMAKRMAKAAVTRSRRRLMGCSLPAWRKYRSAAKERMKKTPWTAEQTMNRVWREVAPMSEINLEVRS